MRRVAVFSLLGPPLGLLVAVVAFAGPTGFRWADVAGAVVLLPFAYLLGLAPAWVAAAVDWYLTARLSIWSRMIATGAAGHVATALLAAMAYNPPDSKLQTLPLFGIVGAIPAAVCSWLSRCGGD